MPRSTSRRHRSLWLMATTSVMACTMAIAPATIDLHSKGPILKIAQADSSCFIAGTMVLMADGTEKPIERVVIGDHVIGGHGAVNRVTGIERPLLGRRRLYALNGGPAFVTAEHPFLTRSGWKAIDPAASVVENSALGVGNLVRGDLLAVARLGTAGIFRDNLATFQEPGLALDFEALARIESFAADPRTRLFNLLLDGDHSYFADGYLVHNKDGGDSDGSDGGDSGDNSGEGSESSGEEGESGEESESEEESGTSKSTTTDSPAGVFGSLEQLGPDLTTSEEAETIEGGWQ